MRKIISIIGCMEKVNKDGEKYFKTLALVDTGDECYGFGKDFKEGDLVEVFYDNKWDELKMKKGDN